MIPRSPAWPRRLAALAAGVVLFAGPAQAESLAQAAAFTLERHPALEADRAAIRAGDASVVQARSGFFPMLRLVADANLLTYYRPGSQVGLFGRTATAQVDQMLWDGWRTPSRTDAAAAERDALIADFQANANAILLNVARAYLNVQREREQLQAAEENLAAHEKQLRRIEGIVKYDPGKGFDRAQIQMRVALAGSQVTERTGMLLGAEAAFRELVGRAAGYLHPPKPLSGAGFEGLEAAIAYAEGRHPAVLSARERLRRRLSEKTDAQGALQPRVDLTARYVKGMDRLTQPGPNDESFAGLSATWLFPLGWGAVAAVDGAEAQADVARNRVAAIRRDLREQVRTTWAQRSTYLETLPLAEAHLGRSREVAKGYDEQYALGRRSVLELLIVQGEVYSARARLIGLTYDRLVADHALAAYMGQLAARLAAEEPPPPGSDGPPPAPTPKPSTGTPR